MGLRLLSSLLRCEAVPPLSVVFIHTKQRLYLIRQLEELFDIIMLAWSEVEVGVVYFVQVELLVSKPVCIRHKARRAHSRLTLLEVFRCRLQPRPKHLICSFKARNINNWNNLHIPECKLRSGLCIDMLILISFRQLFLGCDDGFLFLLDEICFLLFIPHA